MINIKVIFVVVIFKGTFQSDDCGILVLSMNILNIKLNKYSIINFGTKFHDCVIAQWRATEDSTDIKLVGHSRACNLPGHTD